MKLTVLLTIVLFLAVATSQAQVKGHYMIGVTVNVGDKDDGGWGDPHKSPPKGDDSSWGDPHKSPPKGDDNDAIVKTPPKHPDHGWGGDGIDNQPQRVGPRPDDSSWGDSTDGTWMPFWGFITYLMIRFGGMIM